MPTWKAVGCLRAVSELRYSSAHEHMSIADYEWLAHDLVERCMAKFDDDRASPELRAFALDVIVSQISNGNRAMLAHVPRVCRSLAEFSARTPTVSGSGAEVFYRRIADAVSAILDSSPENHAGWLGPVAQYFGQLVSRRDHVETARVACEFWARCARVAFSGGVRQRTTVVYGPWLRKLVTALCDQMIFRDDVEASSFELLRREAELALDGVVRACPCQASLRATFRQLLETRIESESWSEKEAVIRALCVFTQSIDHHWHDLDAMKDMYDTAVPRVMECYSDNQPRLRAVACHALPVLVECGLECLRDQWSRVLMLTAEAARDSVDYVRTAAINSLYNLLYDDYDGRDDADLIGRLVEAVMLAGQCDMVSEIRGVYLRTVGLLVERYGERLGSADMDRVMMPLVDAFQSQRFADGEETDPRVTCATVTTLTTIAARSSAPLYAPYAEQVFEKACSNIEDIVSSSASVRQQHAEDHEFNLHLLSATFSSLPEEALQLTAQFTLLPRLFSTLVTLSLCQRVYQSALRLLGDVFRHATQPTDPPLDAFLDVIRSMMEWPELDDTTRNNAISALSRAAINRSVSMERLLDVAQWLIANNRNTSSIPQLRELLGEIQNRLLEDFNHQIPMELWSAFTFGIRL